MTKKDNPPKPLSRRNISRSVKARAALRDNLAQVTNSFFVAGAEDPPKVDTKVIPVERVVDGGRALHYEVRVEVNGVRLGERASPPGLRSVPVKERIPQDGLREYESLLSGFVPDHLGIDPRPQRFVESMKARIELSEPM
jgi:hypothetical protein